MAARTDHHDEALLALLYDELPPAEAEALRRELAAEAPDVLDRLADYQHIREVAAELPELEPDPQMHYDLLRAARLAAEPDEKPSRLWALIESLSWTPAIAGLLLVVVAAGLTAKLSDQIGEGGTDSPAVELAPGAMPPADEARPASGEAAKGETATSKREVLDTKRVETATPDPAASDTAGLEGALADPEAPVDTPTAQPPAEVALDAARGRNTHAEAPSDKLGDAFGGEGEKAGGAEKTSASKALGERAPSKRDRRAAEPPAAKPAPREVESKPRSKRPPPVVTEQDAAPTKKGEARFAPPPPPPSPAPSQDSAAGAGADSRDDADDLVAPNKAPAPAPGPAATPQAASRGAEPAAPAAEDVALDAVLGGAAPEQDRQEDGLERRAAAAAAPSRAATDEVAELADDAVGAQVEAEEEVAPAVQQARAASPSAVMLDRARGARARGEHRAAVELYEEYLRENGSAAGADRVRYEAAQSYEAIGRADRAMQLYRQVATGGGAFASASRTRMKALAAALADSPPAKKSAPARPRRALDFEAAEPAEASPRE